MVEHPYCKKCGKYVLSGDLCQRCKDNQEAENIRQSELSDPDKVVMFCNTKMESRPLSDEERHIYNDIIYFARSLVCGAQ